MSMLTKKIGKILGIAGSYESPALNLHCTEFEVNNWAISRFVADRLLPVVDVTPFPLNEQILMVAAVTNLGPTHIFEWGTNLGKSARLFYETCRAFGINAEIHSIDLPDDVDHAEHPKENRGLFLRNIPEVKLHLGDGLETSLAILSKTEREGCKPMFFIDGDHSYESVKRELQGIMANAPEANILLHDTFYQLPESGYNIGPCQAIADVLESVPNSYRVISQNIGLPGMTLLWQG